MIVEREGDVVNEREWKRGAEKIVRNRRIGWYRKEKSYQPVCLGMIRSADVLGDVQLFAELCGEIRCETCVSIRNDSIGDSKVWEDVLRVKGRHALTGNGLLAWEK